MRAGHGSNALAASSSDMPDEGRTYACLLGYTTSLLATGLCVKQHRSASSGGVRSKRLPHRDPERLLGLLEPDSRTPGDWAGLGGMEKTRLVGCG